MTMGKKINNKNLKTKPKLKRKIVVLLAMVGLLVVMSLGYGGYMLTTKTAQADTWTVVKYYGYGGTAYKSPAYVYPISSAPKVGTYRACATVRSIIGTSTAAVEIGTNSFPRSTIGTTNTRLCSKVKSINRVGENIIPTVFVFDGSGVVVSNMSVQLFGR